MLPKENRLKKRDEFNLVFKEGRSVGNKFLEIKKKSVKGKKIAFVAPVKVFKKATERNRVKRKLRESFRPFLSRIDSDIGLIFIARKSIRSKSVEEIEEIVEDLLVRLKILKKNDR